MCGVSGQVHWSAVLVISECILTQVHEYWQICLHYKDAIVLEKFTIPYLVSPLTAKMVFAEIQ